MLLPSLHHRAKIKIDTPVDSQWLQNIRQLCQIYSQWWGYEIDLAVTLRPVLDEIDWQQKLELHSDKENGPDGHITHPHEWVDFERSKCETGSMQVYFICVGNEICGTVGALEVNDLLRLKNLVVHSAWRRRGIAQAAVKALRNEAIRLEKQAFGCFALINSIGQRVYERVGLSIVTQQTEWYRN